MKPCALRFESHGERAPPAQCLPAWPSERVSNAPDLRVPKALSKARRDPVRTALVSFSPTMFRHLWQMDGFNQSWSVSQ